MLKMKINDLSQRAQESLTSVLRGNNIGYELLEMSGNGEREYYFRTYQITIDMRFVRIQSMTSSDTIILMNDTNGNIMYLLPKEDFHKIEII